MPKTYNLQLRGFVGGYTFDPEYLSWFLQKNKNTPLTILIESRGGQLAAGISVNSAIRDHSDVTVHFVGMNASAATIASLGAKHITMAVDAWYLVHKASIEIFEWSQLNADQIDRKCKELEKQRAELAKFDVAISEMYARRCKKDPKDMLALMSKETWLTAQEALEWGFIDEITDIPDDIRNEITPQVLSDLSSQGISLPQALSAKPDTNPDSTQPQKQSLLSRLQNLIRRPHEMNTQQNSTTQQSSATQQNSTTQQPATAQAGQQQPDHEPSNAEILDAIRALGGRVSKLENSSTLPQENGAGDRQQTQQHGAGDPQQTQQHGAGDRQQIRNKAGDTLQVVNTGAKGQAEDTFAAHLKSASALFNSLP